MTYISVEIAPLVHIGSKIFDIASKVGLANSTEMYVNKLYGDSLSEEEKLQEIAKLEQNGVKFRYRHCCNSAATLEFPHMHLDMVRPGIILYGCYPSDKVKSKFELTPAMQFRTRVTNVKKVAKGSPISYGGTFVTDKEMIVATNGEDAVVTSAE